MTETDPTRAPEAARSIFNRRALLFAAGAAAALAGAAVGWRKWSLPDGPDQAVQALWPLSFEGPNGAGFSMAAMRGKPLLINFWATWCPPCVEEMPLLDQFYRENKGRSWQVIGLAIDQPSAVRAFLQKTPVSFPIGFAGLGGSELSKALGNVAGALPFTVIVKPDGQVLQRRMGRVTGADLARWRDLSSG